MFQTISGANSIDFIGTDFADALAVFNEKGIKTVGAKDGDDGVDLFDVTGRNTPDVVSHAVVKLGKGADQFSMGSNAAVSNRLEDSTVNGGPWNNTFTFRGATRVKLRGNEEDGDFRLFSIYSDTTINGNSGSDSFTITDQVDGNSEDTITLTNSKILGGSGNDGQINFAINENNAQTAILANNAVIQGGQGVDNITIGKVITGTGNFRVSGGADNDTIDVNNTNAASDGVTYNGAGGKDVITFASTNAADAMTKGGEGNDRITIGSAATGVAATDLLVPTGKLSALGEAGDDTFTLNTVSVAAGATNTGAKHTIEGGTGADVYTIEASVAADDRTELTFVVSNVSDSPAPTTGTTATYDTFGGQGIDNSIDNATLGTAAGESFGYGDIIDMRGGSGEALVGNRLFSGAGGEVNLGAALLSTALNWGAVKTALDGTLTASVSNVAASNSGQISLQLLTIDADADGNLTNNSGTGDTIDGAYAYLNNTNRIVDAGDVMFKLAAITAADAAEEIEQIELAIEAGFDLV